MNHTQYKHYRAGQYTRITVFVYGVLMASIALAACSAQRGNVGVFDRISIAGVGGTLDSPRNFIGGGGGMLVSSPNNIGGSGGNGGKGAAGNGSRNTTVTKVPNGDDCGPIVSQVFRYAVCSCNDISVLELTTDAFNSAQGQSGLTGAAVGVNGSFTPITINPGSDIGGSLTVAGEQGLTSLGVIEDRIRGDLRVQGPLSYSTQTNVSRNAWVGSDITENPTGLPVTPSLHIGGNLVVPTTAAIPSSVTVLSGKTMRQPVTVQPPCACGDQELVDITKIVADGKEHNDNLKANFDADSLSNISGTQRVELPARAFVTSIATAFLDTNASLTLVINQKTSLFVEGDVGSLTTGASGAPIQTEIGPKGSLDMFVGGNFNTTSATMNFGDPKWASKVRVYIAGGQTITLVGNGTFAASLYAPRANVIMAGAQDYYGALFVGNLSATAIVNVHYDSAIISVNEGEDCTPPDQCHACSDCNATSACINGKCGPCAKDADCCEPLVCRNGECAVLLL